MDILLSQIKALTLANLKTRYRGTVSGFLWVILNPIILFAAQSYAFHFVLKIQIQNFPLFLLSGLIPWIFLSQSIEMCTSIFVHSGRLMKSMNINPLVFLSAQIIDNLINFTAAFLILLIPFSLSKDFHFINLLFLPIPLIILFVATTSLCWILATLNVFYRDLKFIMSFIMSVSFYLTPVFYPESFVSENYRWIIKYNIFTHLIAPFRELLMYPLAAPFFSKSTVAFIIAVSLLILAKQTWRKKRNELYLHI